MEYYLDYVFVVVIVELIDIFLGWYCFKGILDFKIKEIM